MHWLFNLLANKRSENITVNKISRNRLPYFISQLTLSDISTLDELSDLCLKLEEPRVWTDKYRPLLRNSNQLLELD